MIYKGTHGIEIGKLVVLNPRHRVRQIHTLTGLEDKVINYKLCTADHYVIPRVKIADQIYARADQAARCFILVCI